MKIRVRQEWRKKSVTNSAHVAAVLRAILASEDDLDRDKEHIWVLGLNNRHNIMYVDLVHLGTQTTCEAHPREVFRRAVMLGAAAVILVHNHPSNDPIPGQDDMNLTDRMIKAGNVLGIKVLDHVIVGENGHLSFADAGML